MTIDQLVTFAILMENGEGILGKDPWYIIEKFTSCTSTENPTYLRQLLDLQNQAKFDRWHENWRRSAPAGGPLS